MSKKDFIELALIVRNAHMRGAKPFSPDQVALLADFCQAQNPNFKRERWLDFIDGKVGPNGGPVKPAPKGWDAV